MKSAEERTYLVVSRRTGVCHGHFPTMDKALAYGGTSDFLVVQLPQEVIQHAISQAEARTLAAVKDTIEQLERMARDGAFIGTPAETVMAVLGVAWVHLRNLQPQGESLRKLLLRVAERVWDALRPYTLHRDGCDWKDSIDKPCKCGLRKLDLERMVDDDLAR